MASKHATYADGAFVWPVRVYFEDTDAGGVVYHAAYLRFFERARTEWLRSLGFDQSAVRKQYGVVFAVRSMTLEFIKPAHLDDQLRVSVFNVSPRRASFKLAQTIQRGDALLCKAQVRVACVDTVEFEPKPIPDAIINEING